MTPSLATLLSEPIIEAVARERRHAQELLDARKDVVLYGAGNLGRKMLAALRRVGCEPRAFADQNVALHGCRVEGVPVMSPAAAVEQFGSNAKFLVCVWLSHGDQGIASRVDGLRKLGCQDVESFVRVAWGLSGVLPHFAVERPSLLLPHRDALLQVYDLLSDATSRVVFHEQLSWRLTGRVDALSAPVEDQYFPKDIIIPNAAEVFIDGGAFDGDTLASIPWPIERAWAFEPDPASAAKLRATAAKNVRVVQAGLGRATARVRFAATGGNKAA